MGLFGSFELHELEVRSELLKGNALGDPTERTLCVLAPRGVAADVALPALWLLPGHGSSQGSFLANDPWKEGLASRVSRLICQGEMPNVRLVLPDCFTALGGSQFIDSKGTGPYASHLWEELVPLFESRFARTGHALAGHSSGGYGALVHAMRFPRKMRAIACHAGDMLFEVGYRPDFPKAATQIERMGGVVKLLEALRAAPRKQDGRWMSALNVIAMAACYSPDTNEPGGVALPFDLRTCELREDVWETWLENDPVHMVDVAANQEALGALDLLFIDAGTRDEWNLHRGARALVRKLEANGVAHVYEEFDDGHMGTSYRFERSLPLLAKAAS